MKIGYFGHSFLLRYSNLLYLSKAALSQVDELNYSPHCFSFDPSQNYLQWDWQIFSASNLVISHLLHSRIVLHWTSRAYFVKDRAGTWQDAAISRDSHHISTLLQKSKLSGKFFKKGKIRDTGGSGPVLQVPNQLLVLVALAKAEKGATQKKHLLISADSSFQNDSHSEKCTSQYQLHIRERFIKKKRKRTNKC